MKLKLEKFEGPLDLLCQLIDDEKLDITDVSLAQVAEQYINYLDQIEIKNPEELADFLVVASRLLYIKSRALLPEIDVDGEGVDELARQLKLYKKYFEASHMIEKIILRNEHCYARNIDFKIIDYKFVMDKKLNSKLLKKIFADVLGGIVVENKLEKRSMVAVVSIREKIEELRVWLNSQEVLKFSGFLRNSTDRSEIIVSFLGLLELVKQRSIIIEQADGFGEINIKKIC